jgi:preprotein translocase subunit SecG
MILAAWYHNILAIVFAAVAVLLMLVILLQRGRGVGLAGAFGGAGGQSAFGAKTGDMLTWATIVIAGLLLLLAVVFNYAFQPLKLAKAPTALVAEPEPPPQVQPPPASVPAPTTTSAPATAPASLPASEASPASTPPNPPTTQPAAEGD